MSNAVLSLIGISKRYSAGMHGCSASVDVLRAVHLWVRSGDVIGLTGRSGAGKSTVLLCAAGLVQPDTGTVAAFGGAVHHPPNRTGAFGYVPERPVYYPFLTVREVLDGYVTTDAVGIPERRRRMTWAVEAAALGEHLRERVGRASPGRCKQVAFALALVAQPRLLLLDDTLSGLGLDTHAILAGTLRTLSARGTAIVITARHAEVLDGVATRHMTLMDGVLRETCSWPVGALGASAGLAHRPVPVAPARVAEPARP